METWAVVIATLVGPVVAVVITLAYQAADRKYQRKSAVFTTMMKMRRRQLSAEYVGALNMVPVEFHDSIHVTQKYRELIEIYSDSGWKANNPDVIARLNERVDTKAAELMSEMAKDLKIKITDIQIMKGAYAPQGWDDEEVFDRSMKIAFAEILAGRRRLQIDVFSSGNDQSASQAVENSVPDSSSQGTIPHQLVAPSEPST